MPILILILIIYMHILLKSIDDMNLNLIELSARIQNQNTHF